MLLRYNPPNEGLWNGVGGRIEKNETPLQACLREAHEETGIVLPKARFGGLLNWFSPNIHGTLALYTAQVQSETIYECDEGELQWKQMDWVFTSSCWWNAQYGDFLKYRGKIYSRNFWFWS